MAPRMEDECISAASSTKISFDVEVAIAELLADPSRASIELPLALSTEQRKHAKKTIQQHPDLKCESFGLGEDRQMHVFKRSLGRGQAISSGMSDASPSVSVKNTFIDDWVNPETTTTDDRVVQSMPHNMFAERLSMEMSGRVASVASPQNSSDASRFPVANEDIAPAAFYTAPGSSPMEYALGTEVVIDGLIKAPAFNGAVGSVQSWDAGTERYDILLTYATASGHRWAKVKAENLRRVLSAGQISFGCFDQ